MESNFDQVKSRSNENGKNILIIVLIILIIISGIKLYTDHVDRTKKSEEILILSEENNDLNRKIDSISYQLELRITEIEKLGGDVRSLEEIREQLIKERSLDKKRSNSEIAALNDKLKGFENVLKSKDNEIIKLREINQQLFSENKDLKSTQAEIEDKVVKLNLKQQELQDKVNVAARLKAENITVAAVNSRGKEREDGFRNRQLERLKITFNLADNKVAEHGARDIYVQVMAPNNQPIFDLAKGSGTFTLNGREEFYTAHQDIIFNNNKQQLTYFYEKGTKYAVGNYEVRIYTDGFLIGTKTFEVK
jgi:chromosome segregation ATPase